MSEILDHLKIESAKLSIQERVELANFLLDTLDDDGAEAAWDAELARRAEEIENGRIIGVPAAAVFARLEQKYGKHA